MSEYSRSQPPDDDDPMAPSSLDAVIVDRVGVAIGESTDDLGNPHVMAVLNFRDAQSGETAAFALRPEVFLGLLEGLITARGDYLDMLRLTPDGVLSPPSGLLGQEGPATPPAPTPDEPQPGFRIEEAWLFTAVDPTDDEEGILVANGTPLLATSTTRRNSIRPMAVEYALRLGLRVRQLHFPSAIEVEVIDPGGQ